MYDSVCRKDLTYADRIPDSYLDVDSQQKIDVHKLCTRIKDRGNKYRTYQLCRGINDEDQWEIITQVSDDERTVIMAILYYLHSTTSEACRGSVRCSTRPPTILSNEMLLAVSYDVLEYAILSTSSYVKQTSQYAVRDWGDSRQLAGTKIYRRVRIERDADYCFNPLDDEEVVYLTFFGKYSHLGNGKTSLSRENFCVDLLDDALFELKLKVYHGLVSLDLCAELGFLSPDDKQTFRDDLVRCIYDDILRWHGSDYCGFTEYADEISVDNLRSDKYLAVRSLGSCDFTKTEGLGVHVKNLINEFNVDDSFENVREFSNLDVDYIIEEMLDKYVVALPIYVRSYDDDIFVGSRDDHLNDNQSNNIGIAYILPKQLAAIYDQSIYDIFDKCSGYNVEIEDRAYKLVESVVSQYSQFLTGEVYSYYLEYAVVFEQDLEDCDDEDELYDSLEWHNDECCSGFYGDDPYENGIYDSLPQEYAKAVDERGFEFVDSY